MKIPGIGCMFCALLLSAGQARGAKSSSSVPRADVKSAVRSSNLFAWDLYKKIRARPGNIFLSPMSIASTLTMASAGARGKTAARMRKVLRHALPASRLHAAFGSVIQSLEASRKEKGYTLEIANRLWGQTGRSYRPSFLKMMASIYDAGFAQVDFSANPEAARTEINDWIKSRTRGRMKEMLPPSSLSAMTRLLITNTAFFKGLWRHQFDKAQTRTLQFHVAPGKKVKVPFMRQTAPFRYAAIDGVKLLEMEYRGGLVAMLLILPRKRFSLGRVEKGLTLKKMKRWRRALRLAPVSVSLPRFRMDRQLKLKKVLSRMGMPQVFTGQADFSGISPSMNLYLSQVIHRATVDVDEEGTVASAATAGMEEENGNHPKVFDADHPFLFLITDKKTGPILFMGRVSNPARGKSGGRSGSGV